MYLYYKSKGGVLLLNQMGSNSSNVDNETDAMKNMIFYAQQKDSEYYMKNEEDEEKTDTLKETTEYLIKYTLKKNIKPILVSVFYGVLICYIIWQLISFAKAVYYLDYSYLDYHWYKLIFVLLSFGIFIISTAFKYWNFHRQKLSFLMLCLFNVVLMIGEVSFRFLHFIFIPLLLMIKISEDVTVDMVILLGRTILASFTVLIIFFVSKGLLKLMLEPTTKDDILKFKITMYVDMRKNKAYLYDVGVIQYMYDGTKYIIHEADRFLHMVITGTTGTGKTSSTMSVKIVDDLDKKVINEDAQKKILEKELKKSHIYMDRPFDDIEFSVNRFKAKIGYENIIYDIKKKYRSCGLTIVAPNAGLTDEVYDLCVARGIKCNRIDPILVDGKNQRKPGSIGFNPLFISPSIPEWDRNREIIKKATLFSDVLQALNEMKGKGDPYFTGINRSVTTAITILLEKTYPILHNGQQPTPGNVQSLVNDFSRIKKYSDAFDKLPDKDEFEFVRDLIKLDLLGQGAIKMVEQIRGLRTILNEFLTNPLIKSVLCAEESVDMDKMLSDGEVTVVNYALELGSTDSVAFGLFFVLSFNDAVVRRPGTTKTRLPHFYDIDELPVLLHPQMERCFSLFRQYCVGMTVAIQSLDQMDRTDSTRYLKGIIMGNCAHHVVFGRSSATEMKMYSELAGKELQFTTQESITQTSITTENPNYSYGERTTATQENVVEEGDIRNRAFQEVTVMSVIEGNIIRPFHGKVSFMADKKRKKVRRYHVDWKAYYDRNAMPIAEPSEQVIFSKDLFITSSGTFTKIPFHESASIYMKEIDTLKEEENASRNSNSEELEEEEKGVIKDAAVSVSDLFN